MMAKSWFLWLIVALFLVANVDLAVVVQEYSSGELVLVHTLFRHGDRAREANIYPKDPYVNETWYPIGPKQLTNKGKLRSFKLGEYLKTRYVDFLGDVYTADLLNARSTEHDRAKMTLELVLAGWFPPEEMTRWHPSLNWQPIPYNYEPMKTDMLLKGDKICPDYADKWQKMYLEEAARQVTPEDRGIYQYLSEQTGKNITLFHSIPEIWDTLLTEEEWGFELPAWVHTKFMVGSQLKPLYPDILKSYNDQNYASLAATNPMKKIHSGKLLRKIVTDSKTKINGTLHPAGRKLFIYSANGSNLATMLTTLGIFDGHAAPYCACIMFEIRKRSQDDYGVQIFYRNSEDEPALLKLPECEEWCPLDQFEALTRKYFNSDDVCGA